MQKNEKLAEKQRAFHYEVFKLAEANGIDMRLFVTDIQNNKEETISHASFLGSQADLTVMLTSLFVNLHKCFNAKDVQTMTKEAYLDALLLLSDEGAFSDE